MELERVIGAQSDPETTREEIWKRVAVVVEEQRVVWEGRHGNEYLRQIVDVLEHRVLWTTETWWKHFLKGASSALLRLLVDVDAMIHTYYKSKDDGSYLPPGDNKLTNIESKVSIIPF